MTMKKLDNRETTFVLNGVTYTQTKTGYCYKSTGTFDKKGQEMNMRIGKHIWEQAFEQFQREAKEEAEIEEWQEEANAEKEAREQAEEQKDRETEDNFNGNKVEEPKQKKASKPRKSKDIAVTVVSGTGFEYTITEKQADFIKHLPDTNFWEDGLDSCLWCDILADEIGGQFAGKPMTVGAMISTLREKGLVTVGKDLDRKGKPKFMKLTVLGQEFARKLGLE